MKASSKTNALLIDLDGVLYQGDQLIPDAADVCNWMNQQAVPHRFVTNTSSRPRSAIVEKLKSLGISTRESEILTPPVAACRWMQSHVSGPAALFIPSTTRKDFAEIEELPTDSESGAGAIVLGDIGKDWTFETLNRAFRLLMDHPKPILVALGMTRYWRTADGLQLDVAPFVKALEYASDCDVVVLGKPAAEFFNQALQTLGNHADETMMIGDDLVGDVQGAQKAGIRGALVKTGKFRPQDLAVDPPPDVVFDSIADLPDWWEGDRN